MEMGALNRDIESHKTKVRKRQRSKYVRNLMKNKRSETPVAATPASAYSEVRTQEVPTSATEEERISESIDHDEIDQAQEILVSIPEINEAIKDIELPAPRKESPTQIEKPDIVVSIPSISLPEISLKLKSHKPIAKQPISEHVVKQPSVKVPEIIISMSTNYSKPRYEEVREIITTHPEIEVPDIKLVITGVMTQERVKKIMAEAPKTEIPIDKDELKDFASINNFRKIVFPECQELIRTFSDRPICIILSKRPFDSHVYMLALICRELYRIRKGGKPIPRWLSKESTDEIEEFLEVGNRLFIIDDSEYEMLPDFSERKSEGEKKTKGHEGRVRESKLLDRLHELFSQDYGFIIFNVKELLSHQLYEEIKKRVNYCIPKLIFIKFKGLHPYVKERIASMSWGFVDTNGKTFDELFGNAEKNYYNELETIYNDIELRDWVKQDPDASFEHEALKILTVMALARKLGAKSKDDIINMLKGNRIRTECEIKKDNKKNGNSNGGKGIADICVDMEGYKEYVEIETFYGVGDPISKLKQTLSKYKGLKPGNRVSIVVQGLHMLLYLRDLISLKNIYRREHGIEVDFYTIDVKTPRLISMKEVIKILKELSMYPREDMEYEEARKSYEYLLKRKLSYNEVVELYIRDCKRYEWPVYKNWCRT